MLSSSSTHHLTRSTRRAAGAHGILRIAGAAQQKRTILGMSKAVDKRLYRAAKSVMPVISKTEDIALGCGTIGFDRDIFTGSPSLQKLLDTYQPKLTPEEQGASRITY